jgi:hypothetical protein
VFALVTAAIVLLVIGALIQVAGIKAGMYATGRPVRDKLPYGLPVIACALTAAVLLFAAASMHAS